MITSRPVVCAIDSSSTNRSIQYNVLCFLIIKLVFSAPIKMVKNNAGGILSKSQ